MRTKKEERAIIFRAVNDAVKKYPGYFGNLIREDIAREAAIIANRRRVNVQSAHYLQDIFMEALDKKEKDGAFTQAEEESHE